MLAGENCAVHCGIDLEFELGPVSLKQQAVGFTMVVDPQCHMFEYVTCSRQDKNQPGWVATVRESR